jgi:hypothetical protein
MQIRFTISAFAFGLVVAYVEDNLLAAYITVFATMILISLRRIQGEIQHFRAPMNVIGTETQIALQIVSQVYRMVAPTIQPSEMFAGDRLDEKQKFASR